MASLLSSKYLAVSPLSVLAASARQLSVMDLTKQYQHYAARLRAYMDERNITGEIASELVGAHTTTIYDLRRGDRKLDDEWRARFAAAFQVDHDVLFGTRPLPAPRSTEIHAQKRRGRKPAKTANDNIPHYGLAAGALVGARAVSPDMPGEVPCPPALRDVPGAYALTVTGTSMEPRFFAGTRLFIRNCTL